MKILSVGDIHTKLWIIDKVEKLVDKYDKIVFVGDFADDWGKDALDTIATWRRMYDFMNKYPDKVLTTCGNHDVIYCQKTPSLQSGYSYVTQLAINSPANKYLKDWLLSLPITLKLDGVTFSHAGVAKGWNGKTDVNSLWQNNSPIWARPEWAQYKKIKQVFGHSPSSTCYEVQKNAYCIDTFSTFADGTPIGDHTVLEVIGGKEFRKIKL